MARPGRTVIPFTNDRMNALVSVISLVSKNSLICTTNVAITSALSSSWRRSANTFLASSGGKSISCSPNSWGRSRSVRCGLVLTSSGNLGTSLHANLTKPYSEVPARCRLAIRGSNSAPTPTILGQGICRTEMSPVISGLDSSLWQQLPRPQGITASDARSDGCAANQRETAFGPGARYHASGTVRRERGCWLGCLL